MSKSSGFGRFGIDLNTVFRWLAILIGVGTAWFYFVTPLPGLLDQSSLWWFAALILECLAILAYERRHRSPLLLTMMYVVVIFHLTRVMTLSWYEASPASATIDRIRPASVDDINEALAFTLMANAAITLGIILVQRLRMGSPSTTRRPQVPVQIVGRLLFWYLVATLGYGIYTSIIVPLSPLVELRLLRFLGLAVNPLYATVIATVYLYQARTARGVGPRQPYTTAISVVLVLLVLSWAAFGSRSSLLTLVQTAMFLFFAMGVFRLPKHAVTAAGLLLALSVPLFTIATIARQVRTAYGDDVSSSQMANWVAEGVAAKMSWETGLQLLSPVIDRTSFLDYTVDLIKNRAEYRQVVNLSFYGMSIVDGLTPGFDVFDMPRSSNALSFVYRNQMHDLKRLGDTYQSDQFNVYGEYYVLFGPWLSLLALCASGAFFQWWLQRIRSTSHVARAIWRYFVVAVFFNWIISFGVDWLVVNGAREAVLVAILLPLLSRPVSASSPAPALSGAVSS